MADDFAHRPQCPVQISDPLFRQLLTGLRQLDIPSDNLAISGATSNRRVALTQCTPIALMEPEVRGFHVKQQSVDNSSPQNPHHP